MRGKECPRQETLCGGQQGETLDLGVPATAKLGVLQRFRPGVRHPSGRSGGTCALAPYAQHTQAP